MTRSVNTYCDKTEDYKSETSSTGTGIKGQILDQIISCQYIQQPNTTWVCIFLKENFGCYYNPYIFKETVESHLQLCIINMSFISVQTWPSQNYN